MIIRQKSGVSEQKIVQEVVVAGTGGPGDGAPASYATHRPIQARFQQMLQHLFPSTGHHSIQEFSSLATTAALVQFFQN